MEAEAWTSKGAATRARIIDAAAALLYERGIDQVGLNDIRKATSTSHGQVFHYFPGGRAQLLQAVVERQTRQALSDQQPPLGELDTWESWLAWKDRLLAIHTERGAIGGCPLGSLTAQLAEEDPEARRLIDAGFHEWTGYLARGLSRMREHGHLLPDADPTALAENILTIVQGGFVLMQASRSIRRLSDALDLALRVLAAAMPPA